jgi:hypothetical protein
MAVLRTISFIALCGVLVCFCPEAMAQEKTVPEYKLKAVFLFNFAKFVEWPESEEANFVVGLVGENPFGNFLEEGLANEKLNGKPIRVQSHNQEHLSNPNVVFLPKSEAHNCSRWIEQFRKPGVLTVSDIPGFCRQGGIIELYMEDGRVRYIINVTEARKAGLTVSAKLLRLGKIVE